MSSLTASRAWSVPELGRRSGALRVRARWLLWFLMVAGMPLFQIGGRASLTGVLGPETPLGRGPKAPSRTAQRSAPLEAGPWVHEYRLTLEAGERVEAGGPLLNYQRSELREQWAVPPLISHVRDRGVDAEEFDLLYPFLTYDRFGVEYRLRVSLLWTFSGGGVQSGDTDRRLTLFPFFFWRGSTDPERRYLALFPLGGRLEDRFSRDEIEFALFPLYSKSRKQDVVTWNYLYPVVHWRTGEGLRGWQFWPLLGRETREPTVRTNSYGDLEVKGGHRKTFVLWPLYFNHHENLGSTNPVHYQALLPFFTRQRSPARDSSTYLWPLFTHTRDREKGYREWDLPWPLIVFARGEGKTTDRIWPFYGRARSATQESRFILWPVYKQNHLQAAPMDRKRTRLFFFLYSDLVEANADTGTAARRTAVWPLFAGRQEADGRERWQALALFEPFLPNNDEIRRNLSPIWALWRTEKNRATGESSHSFLWNLYRYDGMPKASKHTFMFGLFQFEATAEGKRARLFFIPIR